MSLATIEINDAGIEVGIDGEIADTSPGFAVMDGDKLLVGAEAIKNARLLPRWTNNRFWNQLNTDALANATPTTRHHADLAFAHLEALWQPIKDDCDRVIFLVPTFYDRDQLGLLLGMATECGIPVKGVADTALASAVDHVTSDQVLHLDIHLHRITLTQLSAGTLLRRGDTATIADTGMFTFWDRWANIVAKQFIQSSRFDPMHEAGTEQLLFNQLPAWIETLTNQRASNFELTAQAATHSTAVSIDQLSTAGTQIYPAIVQAIRSSVTADTSLLLSHRFSGFPGLQDSLGLVNNLKVINLPVDSAIHGAFTHADNIIPADGGLQHVLSLPIDRTTVTEKRALASAPTHLLVGHQALAIGNVFHLSRNLSEGPAEDPLDPACTFYFRSGTLNADIKQPLTLNQQEATGTMTLKSGDTIEVGGHVVTIIAVT